MADLAKYVVKLEAQTAKYERQLNRANSKLTRFHRKQTDSLKDIQKFFIRMLPAAVLLQVVRYTDRFQKLNTRLRTATRTTGDFAKVQRELVRTSVDLGASLETSIEQFQGLSRLRNDLGLSNDQALVLNRTIAQLGVIGGTSSADMSRGLRQLNQGLAAGTLRAEEFNSLVENTPELIARIALGFNKTQGELRQMLLDGKLFASDVIEVLLKAAPEIAEQFKEIPADLTRSTISLTTAVGNLLSGLDSAAGFTVTIASNIASVAKAINNINVDIFQNKLVGLQSELSKIDNQLESVRSGGAAGVAASVVFGTENELLKERVEILKQIVDLRGKEASGPVSAKLKKKEIELRDIDFTRVRQGPPISARIANEEKLRNELASAGAGLGEGTTTADDVSVFAKIDEFNKKLKDSREAFSELFGQNMVEAADNGFSGILESWADTLKQMAAKALASKLFDLLANLGGGGTGSLGGAFAGIFGGARANGGPVSAGKSFLVGERGPELFTPSANGMITPNAGGMSFNTVINAQGAGAGVREELEAELNLRDAQLVNEIRALNARGRL